MTESSSVAVVFQDLSDALTEISSGSTSPKTVRCSFGSFVDLSQKLTSSMRKEYSAKTGESWAAFDFDGWNNVTELFKELRRVDQHEYPIAILVHETQYFSMYEGGPKLVFDGTWSFSLEDQLLENPRDDIRVELADPETGQPSGRQFVPVSKEYEFHLSPSSKKAKELLVKIGEPNIRILSEICFKVLKDYYQYYQRQLARS